MPKAVGWASSLVVAVSILAIAFRAGTQTSPYMPVGTRSSSPSNQSPYASMPSAPESGIRSPDSVKRTQLPSDPRGANGGCRIKILSVTPTDAPDSHPTAPGAKENASKPIVGQAFQPDQANQARKPDLRQPDKTSQARKPDRPKSAAASGKPATSPTLKANKSRIRYPDAVSPYHPDVYPPASVPHPAVPGKTKAAGPQPPFDEVIWRVIENPAHKRQGMTPAAAAQYFANPPQAEESEPGATTEAQAEPEPLKLEGAPARTVPVPDIESPKEVQPTKQVDPIPIETTPPTGEPIGRLPEMLPENPPTSLIDVKAETTESAAARGGMPTGIPTTPTPVPEPRPKGGAVVQAKYVGETAKQGHGETAKEHLIPGAKPAPAVITAKDELSAPLTLPCVTSEDAKDTCGCVGQASERNAHAKQASSAQVSTPIPPAAEKCGPGPKKNKAVKVISVLAKPALPEFSLPQIVKPQASFALTGGPASVGATSETDKVEEVRPSLPIIINHSPPPTVPMASIQEAKKKERVISVPKEAPKETPAPRKLPASITDSPLVLGPARELLEDAAAKPAGPKASSAPVAAEPIILTDTAGAKSPDRKAPEAKDSARPITLTGAPEKTAPVQAKPQPYLEKWLKDYIQGACGELANDLEITLEANNRLQVHFRVKNDADAETIGRKILNLPELAPYQVSLDIAVLP